jgi:hypothetical protein
MNDTIISEQTQSTHTRVNFTFFSLLIKDEKQSVIDKPNTRKSLGPNKISNKMLKNLFITAIDYLIELINLLITHGYFPIRWKQAELVFIPKYLV